MIAHPQAFRFFADIRMIAQILAVGFRVHGVDQILQQLTDAVGCDFIENLNICFMQQLPTTIDRVEYEGKVIGSLGIEKYDEEEFPEFAEKSCREIGYVLSKEYWGRGLMPEAVKEVIRYLFEDVGLDVIFCGHFLRNIQSKRVQEKCGFEHYAFGKYETVMGTVEDNAVNILTKEKWYSR